VAARLGQAFAEAVAASVGEGVYAVDLHGDLTFLNPAAAAILGWDEGELLGSSMHDAIHSLDPAGNPRSAESCLLLRVIRDGQAVRVDDDVFVRRDGSLVPVAYTSSPMVTDGEVVGAVVAFHDITQQKASQERLRSEAEVNEALLRIAGTLNAERDVETVVQLVTDAGTLLSGAAFGALSYVATDGKGDRELRWAITGDVELANDADVETGRVFATPPASYLRVAVNGRDGRTIGTLHFGHPRRGVFTEQHERLVEAVAAHAAIAFENATESAFAQSVSETLQRSLLPRSLPSHESVRVVARYQPAQQGVEVGGDWYDVIELGDGRLAVVIGDVAGHNLHAASVMGEIRNAVRAYALDGHSPAGVVERANRFLCNVAPAELATCCYIELQPAEGTATVVLAGHPPPLVASGDGRPRYVDAESNVPIGVDPHAHFDETTVLLDAAGWLVLYTDGLIDQAAITLEEGFDRLQAATASAPQDPDAAADSILAATVGVRADDAALLLVALEGVSRAAEHDVGRLLPSDPRSAAAARRFVADVLASCGDDVVATATLLVSELVTNAVLHTVGQVELRIVQADDRIRISVADESGERPAELEEVDLESTSGRGLMLVDALAAGWGVEAHGVGKRVWFDLARLSVDV
jgi:PAS domain S-box-containing protein